jgi:hypothetical protein
MFTSFGCRENGFLLRTQQKPAPRGGHSPLSQGEFHSPCGSSGAPHISVSDCLGIFVMAIDLPLQLCCNQYGN